MAGKIPAGEMVTRTTLDATQPVQTLKELKTNVSSLTSSWKAENAELRSAGDALGAASAKYKGLSDSIQAQRDYLERLKNEQSSVDKTTNEGSEQYAKLGRQIASAATKLNSMTAQQTRAKDSMDYYKSGIASAQEELRKMSTVSGSYVDRLRAEGKQEQANRTEMTSLQEQYARMNDIYNKQRDELERIATESGKDSDAYSRQTVRVNEMATSMAKTKGRMTELDDSMKKANPSVFDKLRNSISKVNDTSEKTPGLLHKIVEGGLITNAVTTGWQDLSSGIESTVKSGIQLNEAGEAINHTWSDMGKSANDVKALDNQMVDLRAKTGDSAAEVNSLQRLVDNLTHGNTSQTMSVSQGIATIGTASRLTGEQTDSLAKSLVRVTASGKVTDTSLARLEKTAPTMGAQLAKAAGMSQQAFSQMVSSGKMSSTQFLALLTKVGQDGGGVFKQFGSTAEGAEAQMSASWMTLKTKMTAPLVDVKTSGLQSVTQILASSVVQQAATELGKAIAEIANKGEQLLNYVGQHKADVSGIAKDLGQIVVIAGETVWSVFKGIVSDIAQFLGVGGKNAKTMKDPLKAIHDVLNDIVQNKSGIQDVTKTILALLAVDKALKFASAIGNVYSGLKNLTGLSGGLSKVSGWLGKATGSQEVAGGALESVKSAGGVSALSTAGKVSTGLAGAGIAVDAGSSIVSAFKDKGGSTKQYQDAGKGIGAALGGGIGLYFGGPLGAALGASIGKIVGGWGGSAAKTFVSGWNKVGKGRKPTDWLGAMGWDARQMTNSVVKWWNDTNKASEKSQKQEEKQELASQKQSQKQWNSFWKTTSKGWNGFWNGVGNGVKSWDKKQQASVNSDSKSLSKNWNSFWKTSSKSWSGFWNGVQRGTGSWVRDHERSVADSSKNVRSNWNSFWGSTSKGWSGFWGGVTRNSSSSMISMRKTIGSISGKIADDWNSWTKGLASGFSSIWSGIQKAARDGMNGVKHIINDAIGGINTVWHFFTGKNAISKLATGGVIKGGNHLVMVNDDGSDHYKELIQLPNGKVGMFQQPNQKALLPEGTRVYNGRETQQIMSLAGIEHYASGGIIGDVKSFISDVSDKASAIGDWLKNPVKSVENMVDKSISGVSAGVSSFTELGVGVVKKLVKAIAAWMQKRLKPLEDSLDGGGQEGNPGGSGVQRWKDDVIKALKANHFSASASQVSAWLRVIARESNGNPHAVNNWDSNAKKGTPSKGLVQTIGPTFDAYKFPGHGDIFNGYDDLLAGIHYMAARYGRGASAFARVSGPEGYANGGLATHAAIFGENGAEMAIPLSAVKSSRGYELLGKTAAAMAARDNLGGSQDVQDLSNKLDAVISLLQSLTGDGLQLLQTIADKDLTLDGKKVAKGTISATSTAMQRRQILTNRGVSIANSI